MRFLALLALLLSWQLYALDSKIKPPLDLANSPDSKPYKFTLSAPKPKEDLDKNLNKDDKNIGRFISIYNQLYTNDKITKEIKLELLKLKTQAFALTLINQADLEDLKARFSARQNELLAEAQKRAKISKADFKAHARAHELDIENVQNASNPIQKPILPKLADLARSEKLADEPKDQALRVRVHTGSEYCFSPVWTEGESYLYLVNCNYASKARYDVFGRISWNHEGTYICLTAPSSVTGIEGEPSESWDYMRLRPCAINDKNQQFIVQDNAIWTADKRFKMKDYSWYAYISKNKDDYYDHKLVGMDAWVNTIARPATLTVKTFVGWSFVDRFEWAVYYLQNDRSYADVIEWLYYNPENGHIAQYYRNAGYLYCMTSNASKGEDWNWVSWEGCNDDLPKKTDPKNGKNWRFLELVDNEGYLQDYLGNLLRISEYGTNWGVPWVGSIDYIEKRESKYNVPKSLFLFSDGVPYWEGYVNGNIGQTLDYCPAPGFSKEAERKLAGAKSYINGDKAKEGFLLPPSFSLTPAWISRFHEIAITTPQTTPRLGVCGVCLVQSFEMVAEMMAHQYGAPPIGRGVFFNLRRGGDPIASLQNRHPILAERLINTRSFADRSYRDDEDLATRTRRIIYSITTMFLPEYDWHSYELITSPDRLSALTARMLRAPVGTLWVTAMNRSVATGGFSGHVQPILRTNDGIVFIPTNGNISLQQYTRMLRPITNAAEMEAFLTAQHTRRIITFALVEVTNRHVNRADRYFSNHSCTGGGANQHGSGALPTSATINQCQSGRCLIQ
ncbi:MAG: DUF1561 family protein [Helicobacter sp.]|nr:DUF1561 family protein [Helicobacter sp.]